MLVTEQNYKEIRDRLAQTNIWTIDVETNGLDSFDINQICGLGIGTLEGEVHYFPFRHLQGTNLPIDIQKDLIALANNCKTLIGYNLKFDLLSDEKLTVMKKYGVWGKKSFMGKKFMGTIRTTFLIASARIAKRTESSSAKRAPQKKSRINLSIQQ